MRRIVPIVEGQGDERAVPILIRRVAAEVAPGVFVDIRRTIRQQRSKLVMSGQLERYVELAARDAGPGGAVLVVIDSDDQAPCVLGPELLERARGVRPALMVAVVLAHQEFEAWFVAAAESLRGHRDLPVDLDPPRDPEAIRGAKEWLDRHMPRGRAYSETRDQPALAARFDLTLARRAGSFDKCYREIVRLLTEEPARGG